MQKTEMNAEWWQLAEKYGEEIQTEVEQAGYITKDRFAEYNGLMFRICQDYIEKLKESATTIDDLTTANNTLTAALLRLLPIEGTG